MIKIDLQYNKETPRWELTLHDERTNRASYVYAQPSWDQETTLKSTVNWLNKCFEQIDDTSK